MTNYFTGGGDKGLTNIATGRLRKDDPIIEAIGELDELNSSLGLALFYTHDDPTRKILREVQNELFTLGANLATAKPVDKERYGKLIVAMEKEIKSMGSKMPELRKFVLPGGCEGAAHLHLSRAVARRCERRMVALAMDKGLDQVLASYMNRLSSLLFVAAIYLNHIEGVQEENPTY